VRPGVLVVLDAFMMRSSARDLEPLSSAGPKQAFSYDVEMGPILERGSLRSKHALRPQGLKMMNTDARGMNTDDSNASRSKSQNPCSSPRVPPEAPSDTILSKHALGFGIKLKPHPK
jgi:hypothetical protein